MKKYTKKLLILLPLIFISLAGYSNDKVYQIETLTKGLDRPWSLGFLPNGDILISELTGNLRIYNSEGLLSEPLSGVPKVFVKSQGGLSDIAIHPNFIQNKFNLSLHTRQSAPFSKSGIETGCFETLKTNQGGYKHVTNNKHQRSSSHR